jgi:hypothetical protein
MHTLSLVLQSCLNEPSESVMNTNDDDDDDNDVWCNQQDEDNLEHRVKFDHEREEELRKMLGDETLQIIREALKVKETFRFSIL